MTKKKVNRYRIELERQFDSEDFRRKTVEVIEVSASGSADAGKKARLLAEKKTEHVHDYDVVYSVKSVVKI